MYYTLFAIQPNEQLLELWDLNFSIGKACVCMYTVQWIIVVVIVGLYLNGLLFVRKLSL